MAGGVLDVAEQRRHRRPQLVRGVGEEPPLAGASLLERGQHPVEHARQLPDLVGDGALGQPARGSAVRSISPAPAASRRSGRSPRRVSAAASSAAEQRRAGTASASPARRGAPCPRDVGRVRGDQHRAARRRAAVARSAPRTPGTDAVQLDVLEAGRAGRGAARASRSCGSSRAPSVSERAMSRPRASITSTAIWPPETGLSSAPGAVSTAGAETASCATSWARWRNALSSEPRSSWPTSTTVATRTARRATRIDPAAARTKPAPQRLGARWSSEYSRDF